jgi:hypothetical protein
MPLGQACDRVFLFVRFRVSRGQSLFVLSTTEYAEDTETEDASSRFRVFRVFRGSSLLLLPKAGRRGRTCPQITRMEQMKTEE